MQDAIRKLFTTRLSRRHRAASGVLSLAVMLSLLAWGPAYLLDRPSVFGWVATGVAVGIAADLLVWATGQAIRQRAARSRP
jgi:hypothetical protein